MARLTILLMACGWSIPASADWPAANPARPSFSSNADTVPGGALQTEFGAAVAEDSVVLPVGLRLGGADRIEADVSLSPKVDDPTAFGSLGVGAKLRLFSAVDEAFRMAALGLVEVPTDDREMGGSLALIATWVVGSGFQLDANVVGTVTDPGTGDRVGEIAPVATLSRVLWGDLGGYLESYARIPTDRGDPAAVAAVGLGYTVTPFCVLDAAVDAGLTDAAPDYVVQVGVTTALPVW